MLVNFDDTNANWLKWGDLVRSWVFGQTSYPADTTTMLTQMQAAGITNPQIPGPPRAVVFVPYNSPELIIPVPTQAMILASEQQLGATGVRPYPVKSFYDLAYDKPVKANLDAPARLDIGKMRLGEYVILECQ